MESSQDMFLDFISTEAATNLGEIKKNIAASAQCKDSLFKELSNAFIKNFGKCFDGEVASISGSSIYSNTLFTAARVIGLAYLKQGEVTGSVQSLIVALAFFQSVPKEMPSIGGTDYCDVDFVEIAKKDKEDIERREVVFQQFRDSNPSRGVRKVTTGITGLWQPSVHSDVAF
ncbi:hypothetical protein U3516DRAFT_742852 [Neocallimastix sp. 'constans']